ncbi:MAG: tRNA pseudouridine(55) synthase TruB [Planctomycetota bacterium]|nr:MAG: tRNA pseudouridine(55) synthase TruB [Planctomycetota bacterium]REK26932.1 MAG: tRNA pseudouridine(55) synthase TruB [Planctomycetota bacterium]REK35421.1 MAG: tRNA pseudouridine(55) synthase TruB [Planctomycetota bacterium]
MTRAWFTISVSETTGYREIAQRAALFERIAPRCHVNGDARWQRALRIIRAKRGGRNAAFPVCCAVMFGLLNLNKPSGRTSRDVVNRVQRLVRPAKVGHAGTLDPLASGVLVVCLGPATRLVPILHELPKVYRGTFRWGCASESDDVESDVTQLTDAPQLTAPALESVLPEFLGTIEQVPPSFSAVKIGGRRAYKLARAGNEVRPPPRRVEIHRLELLELDADMFRLEIECGTGTYVRSLGRDIAVRLGSGAVMTELTRVSIGPFDLADSVPVDRLGSLADIDESAVPPLAAINDWPRCEVDASGLELLRNGRPVPAHGSAEEGTRVAIVAGEGGLVAIGEQRGDEVHPKQVFITVRGAERNRA